MRLAAFFAALLSTLAAVAGLDWWIDPFLDRYHPEILSAALAQPKPCFVSWEVLGEQSWPQFKLDLAHRRDARVIVIGTSRVAKIGAWAGERDFVNVGLPGEGPESLGSLFHRLHGSLNGRLTIYLGTDAFWFGRSWHTRVSFGRSYLRELKYVLSGETFARTLRTLREAPGALLHPQALQSWEVDQAPLGCVVDRGHSVVHGASNSWGPDGTLYFQYELTKHASPTNGTLVTLYRPFYSDKRMEPWHVDALDDALGLAQHYGWRVVGFQAPIAPAGIAALQDSPGTAGLWHDYQTRIAGIYARHGYRYLDLTDVKSVPCGSNDFSFHDDGHPDIACGRAIRLRLDVAAGIRPRR